MAALRASAVTDDGSPNRLVYVVVSNIPRVYHSHRPAIHKVADAVDTGPRGVAIDSAQANLTSQVDSQKTCGIVRLSSCRVNEFIKMYHGKHWVDREGNTLYLKCFITRIRVADEQSVAGTSDGHQRNYKTRKEQRMVPSDRITFTREDLQNLAELRPPNIMPNGNVGTPTSIILELIRACRMPSRMIRKLGLIFPKIRGARLYGSVPYDYGGKVKGDKEASSKDEDYDVHTATGQILTDIYMKSSTSRQNEPGTNKRERHTEEDDDDDMGEEWDRHEAFHDDVTEQGRTKERLYEEEIELKWEKGGSGLVFYTDAQYWDEQKGDFDERTADDWDIDTSIYYNPDDGDKDAEDYVEMLISERRRSGSIADSVFHKKIGRFEKHTKGIGRRLLERRGWTDGQGLGRTIQGIPQALGNDGKHPRDKKGFGYHGEKLPRFNAKRARKDVCISTVYDEPSQVDPPEPLLRRNPATILKHRVNFRKAEND